MFIFKRIVLQTPFYCTVILTFVLLVAFVILFREEMIGVKNQDTCSDSFL